MEQDNNYVVTVDETVCYTCKQRGDTIPGNNVCYNCFALSSEEYNVLYESTHGTKKQTPALCEHCSDSEDAQPPIKYCELCENFLCKACSEFHQGQKLTRSHELVGANDAPKPTSFQCDACRDNDIVKIAIKYCKKCESYLCKRCATIHQRQKITNSHELVDAKINPKQPLTLCNDCKSNNVEKPATKYCIKCESFLCQTCTNIHQRLKITKFHELVDPSETPKPTLTLCDDCKSNDEEKPATKYCKICESLLCQTCTNIHQRLKITKSHELLDPSEAPKPTLTLCDDCKSKDEEKPATTYCKLCESLLCQTCTVIHQRQGITKSHALVDYTEATKPTSRVYGKPWAMNVTNDSIDLNWEYVTDKSLVSRYQIRFKDVDKDFMWKILPNEFSDTPATISNLKADTKYVFQVQAVYDDDEGPYSETSDEIVTLQSPATRLLRHSLRVSDGEPAVYALPLTEFRPARNEQAKTRKFSIGPPPLRTVPEKTIMLVGATGTGKSTLIDGIVNYVLGVNWNDPFRFTLEHLEEEEAARKGNLALSQTEWITCYTINPEQGGRLDYKLTIIDTPGFYDTRGLDRDKQTVDQIRQLFSAPGEKGVVCIDAVCFLVKAPDARITIVQKYIFNSILSLYGNDIKDNIRTLVTFADEKDAIFSLYGNDIAGNIKTLVTFADGMEPPVLAALRQSDLPFGRHFTFNNAGLFAGNKNLDSFSLAPMFWELGTKSFREFFIDLATTKSVSLKLTKEVLEERQKLELTIGSLPPTVDAVIAKLDALKQELKKLEEYEVDIENNKNFIYEVEDVRQTKKDLEPGVYSMNCLQCNFPCHARCTEADDNHKAKCVAMDSSGNCKVCPGRCRWKNHKSTNYTFEYQTNKVKKTYAEMKKKYETAVERKHTAEQILQKMYNDFKVLQENIESLMCVVNQSNNRLKEIALRPNPLNMVEHIDLMIESEKMEMKEGFLGRIKALKEYRKRATSTVYVDRLNEQARQIMKGKTK